MTPHPTDVSFFVKAEIVLRRESKSDFLVSPLAKSTHCLRHAKSWDFSKLYINP